MHPLDASVHVHLHDAIAESSHNAALLGSRSVVEEKKSEFSWPTSSDANFWKLDENFVHAVDVAESGSNGKLLRDGRQFLQHLYTSSEYLHADAALVNAAMPNLALHQDWHERQILSMCSSVITRTSTTRHDAASEEPPPAPHCLDSAPTQNRRSCETLSPAAPELVAITWTISNRRAEEKCDITDNCLTQEMNQLATHRAIATHAEQLAWRSSDHCRTANATDDNSPSPK